MGGSHLSIECDIETHIAIGSRSKTEGFGLKILGLSPETAGQVVQHAFHSDAPLPLIGKMGKKIEPDLGPLPLRSRSVGTSFFQKFLGIRGMVITTVNGKIRFNKASAPFFRKRKGAQCILKRFRVRRLAGVYLFCRLRRDPCHTLEIGHFPSPSCGGLRSAY